MRLKKLGDWIQYATCNGQTFYYNQKNGEFQFTYPESLLKKQQSQRKNSDIIEPTIRNVNSHSNSNSSNNSNNQSRSSMKMPSPPKSVPNSTKNDENNKFGDWRPYMDPDTGFIFWYNLITEVSTWDCPIEIQLKTESLSSNGINHMNMNSSNIHSNAISRRESTDELVQVNHLDDLGL